MARRRSLDSYPRPRPRAIRAARKRAGLSQVQAAVRAGFDPGTLSRLERGEIQRLHPARLIALADALGTTPEQLATGVTRVDSGG